ncbi:hypothetical protein PV11_08002 [Exophiala sideris]|uniref:Myb-like domain-containing protein n=1 Tax=Exophiala sideris TaxID=1016849 RepID=A0A0D1WZF3_9EURO|nr:hypothetical protein PV11_08002 [Exophiala sideris]
MSTFSSVVRKPGQKITPKTAPRRNIQRASRHAAPPSLTPESRTVSPSIEPAEETIEGQERVQEPAQTVLESTEIPSTSHSIETSLPLPAPLETSAREPTEQPSDSEEPVSVEVTVPSSTSQGISILHPVHSNDSTSTPNTIPTIATSSTPLVQETRQRTHEPIPAQLDGFDQENDDGSQAQTHSPTDSRKRRKITHSQENNEPQLPATPPPTDETSLLLRASPRNRRSESQTSDALLQDATSRFAEISQLANSIESRARSLRPRSERASYTQSGEDEEEEDEADGAYQTPEPTSARRKRSRAKRIEALAQQVIEDAVSGGTGGRRQSRLSTPENAEEMEIDPEEVSMADLVKDNKIGRKSTTENRMQENWEDIKRRRKEEVERRREAAAQGRHGRQALVLSQDVPVEDAVVPQQIIINGQIVVTTESREVAFGAGVEQAVIEDADVALEDDRIYKYVNQGTLGKHAGRRRGTRWDDEQTELFYKGLRMFGTDFAMIANLFPGLDRKQVKLKYIIEERADPVRVRNSVAAKETVDIEEYSRMTNQEYEDPDKIMAELAAEEKRLREEDRQRRTNEGYVLEEADVPLPSTERDHDGIENTANDDTEAGMPAQTANTDRRDRVSALAETVVAAAVAPKRKQAQRKTKEPVGRGRQAKKGRGAIEGIEERIGPIDEVER